MRHPSIAVTWTALAVCACAVNPVPTPADQPTQGGAATAVDAAGETFNKAAEDATTGGPIDGGAALDLALPPQVDAAPDVPAAEDAADAMPDAPPPADTSATDAGPAPDAGADAQPSPPLVPPADAVSGMQYNGSVAFKRKAKPGLAWAEEFVEISAPIVPKTTVIYPKEGPNFPKDLAGMQALAHEAALTYDFLLTACKPDYPGITLTPADGKKLTKDQLLANYALTAECSYKKWVAKPYWIPKLLADVDICGTELGKDWSMLAEADVTALTQDQAQVIADGLTAQGGQPFGAFYYSTAVFVKTVQPPVMTGKLEVGAQLKTLEQATPCPGCGGDLWTKHFEGGYGLRCIRVRGVAPAM